MITTTYDFLIEENILEKLKSKIKINFNFFEKLKKKNQFRMKKMKRILASNGIDYSKIDKIIQSKVKKFSDFAPFGNGDISFSEIIREIITEMREAKITDQIKSSVLLTLSCVIFNSVILALLIPLVGPVVANLLTAVIVAPISEESTKLISTKVGATGMNFIVFNITETALYASRIFAAGFGVPMVLLLRTPAILMHFINTIRHKYYDIKGYKEGDKNKYNMVSFGENAFYHGIYNLFASFPNYFSVLIGSLINMLDINTKLKIIR